MKCNDDKPVVGERNTAAFMDKKNATEKVFEESVETILKNATNLQNLDSWKPSEVYRLLATGAYCRDYGGLYEFRLVNGKKLVSTSGLDQPFNVYGDIAVSFSHMPHGTVAPVPYIRASLNEQAINRQREAFEAGWKAAESSIDAFAATMSGWRLFGSGQLMRQWVDI